MSSTFSSSGSGSSPSSSRSPSPIPEPSARSKNSKSKKNTTADDPRNEGVNPHWAFKPPSDAVLLDHNVDPEDFDWDAIKDDEDIELWLVRAPAELKPKHLESLKLDVPSKSTSRVGVLARKHVTYDVWSVPASAALASATEGLAAPTAMGVEEVRGLTCLLPQKRKSGKLYIAPKTVSRHVVVTPQPPRASSPRPSTETNDAVPHDMYQNPPRPSYSSDVLKHRFVPYGARAGTGLSNAMDVDGEASTEGDHNQGTKPSVDSTQKGIDQNKEKDGKGTKRKSGPKDGVVPKKQKKTKVE